MLFSKSLSQKRLPIGQEERDLGYERRTVNTFFCML